MNGLKPLSFEEALVIVEDLISRAEVLYWNDFVLGRFRIEQRLFVSPWPGYRPYDT